MRYQQSPAMGDWIWDAAPKPSPRCSWSTWPPLQLTGSSRCGRPLSPDWPDHKCERAQHKLTCVLLSLRCPGLPSALPRARPRLWQLPDGGVRWAAVPNRDRKVPGPACGGYSASGPLCEPTAARGGWRCASHHPPVGPSIPVPDTAWKSREEQAYTACTPGGQPGWTLWTGCAGAQGRPRGAGGAVKGSPPAR